MARAADGSGMTPSADTAARATRGSPLRSSGCSSGTRFRRPRCARAAARAFRCTNQRLSSASGARRLTAGAPKPTTISAARCVARAWCSSAISTGFSASMLAGPMVATTVAIVCQLRRRRGRPSSTRGFPHRDRLAQPIERQPAGVAADAPTTWRAPPSAPVTDARVLVGARQQQVLGQRRPCRARFLRRAPVRSRSSADRSAASPTASGRCPGRACRPMPPAPAAGRRPPAVRRGRRRRRARCGTTPTRTACRCTRSAALPSTSTAPGTVPALPKSVSLSMLRVIVRTRRLRSSSGAMVLKIVASRSDARPSSASAVASSCATFASSNAAATPATSGTSAFGSSARLHHLHDDVRVELPGREGEVASSRPAAVSGDITETMLVRCRNAARTAAACEVIIGEPSTAHFGASTAAARSPMSTRAAGDRQQPLLRRARRTPLSGRRRSSSRSSARDRRAWPARGRRPLRARTAPRNRAARGSARDGRPRPRS